MPLLLILLLGLLPRDSTAQEDERVVGQVLLEHSTRLSDEVLRSQLGTRVGMPYQATQVDRDQKALGERYSVRVDARVDPFVDASGRKILDPEGREQVVVRFRLTEYQAVRRVEFEGNDELSDEELQDSLGLTARGVVPRGLTSRNALDWLVERLRERYREEGFLYAEIRPELRGGAEESERILHFDVLEGPKVHVDDIVFLGLEHFTARNMRSIMETSESFLFFRNTFKEEALKRDLGALEEFLRDEGYLDARVALETLEFSPDHKSVDVVLRIDAEAYIASAAKTASGLEQASQRLSGIAKQHSAIVMLANCMGGSADFLCAGSSSAWGRSGQLLARLDGESEGVIVVDYQSQEVVTSVIP